MAKHITKAHISQTGSEYGSRFEAVEAWNRRVNDGKDDS